MPLPFADSDALIVTEAGIRYEPLLDSLVFSMTVAGDAASLLPQPAAQLDCAPVLGYVFPTTLAPAAVGFGSVSGTLALAIASHPDFDDTPLWDEDNDDDGVIYHAHWVVLGSDDRAPAGLAAAQADKDSVLPPTAPMPMYLDSPGFTVIENGSQLEVIVPLDRVHRESEFKIGAMSAYMEVDARGDLLLAVHGVYSQLEGGNTFLSVQGAAEIPSTAWPAFTGDDNSLDLINAAAQYTAALDSLVFSQQAAGSAATLSPTAIGSVYGAPVPGYVFPTSISPSAVGIKGTSGLLVLAVTSHPDFDDTPLWDENFDENYQNDGTVFHVHWAVLEEDPHSPMGLSVPSQLDPSMLPPTASLPMYLDSPGYHAFASGNSIHVVVRDGICRTPQTLMP